MNGTATTYSYNAANEVNGWTYDADGNLLVAGTTGIHATYNAKNQTDQVAPTAASTYSQMAYAGMGQDDRLQAGNSTFHNDKLGTSIEYSQSLSALGVMLTSRTEYYIRDPRGNLVEEAAGAGFGNVSDFYVFDGLGSVVQVSGSGGATPNTYQYDPFGQTVSSSGTIQNSWGFAGQYHDASGLYKMGARYYDPSSGRWTQQDSVVNPLDQHQSNRYIYVGEDPVNYTDGSGTCGWSDWSNGFSRCAMDFGRFLRQHATDTAFGVAGCIDGAVFFVSVAAPADVYPPAALIAGAGGCLLGGFD